MKNLKERVTLWENKKPSLWKIIKFNIFEGDNPYLNFHYQISRSLPFEYMLSFGSRDRFGYRETRISKLHKDGDTGFGSLNSVIFFRATTFTNGTYITDYIKGFIIDELFLMSKFRKLI